MQETIILGGGGHAKVIIEILREAGLYEPVGCLAPAGGASEDVLGVPILGDDDCLAELRRLGIPCVFVAVGNNTRRSSLMRQVTEMGFELASAVSPSATISPSARLGSGLAVMPGANIGPDTVVEDGVIINSRSSVDHDGELGECCHIGPGATLAGCVHVGAAAFVATGSSVIPDISIGRGSVVGAGSVVVRDVPANVIAYGCPAVSHRSLDGTAPEHDDGDLPTERHTGHLRLVI